MAAGGVKYAVRGDSGWEIELVDKGGSVGWYLSLQLDRQDRPHLVYLHYATRELKYAMIPAVAP